MEPSRKSHAIELSSFLWPNSHLHSGKSLLQNSWIFFWIQGNIYLHLVSIIFIIPIPPSWNSPVLIVCQGDAMLGNLELNDRALRDWFSRLEHRTDGLRQCFRSCQTLHLDAVYIENIPGCEREQINIE